MAKMGLVFPGQGVQSVGMGGDLYESSDVVRTLFAEAGDVLETDIAGLCLRGPQAVLDETLHTQLAVLTVDIAVYSLFREESGADAVVMAGHSLGEYAALYAAGAIGFADVLRLVKKRAVYHRDAVPQGVGAMAAVLGPPSTEVEEMCRTVRRGEEVLSPAIFNGPGQTVVAGHAAAVERLMEEARRSGRAKTVRLPISVPCHTSLLQNAAERLREDMRHVSFRDCRAPVIPNCDPSARHSRAATPDLLARQITSPVRWEETVAHMAGAGVDTIIELGPKKTLCGLIKRIDPRFRLLNVEDSQSLCRCLQALGTNPGA
ncbi:MAG TPA: ACP S-malonyltransferase [Syntrophales bacterium]|nr:ACP S-malonyltransferase [Syntrophales bacterium]